MKKFKEISLGQEAIDYIKDILAHGHTLGNLLFQNIDFSSGQIITYVPYNVSKESIQEFEKGGKIKVDKKDAHNISLNDTSSLEKSDLSADLINATKFVGQFHKTSNVRVLPVPNTDFWLIPKIQNFIEIQSICIFENALSQPSDPWLSKRKTKILLLHNEIYHFMTLQNSSKEEIQNIINETRTSYPPLIGVMATTDVKINDGDKIDLDLLKLIVQKTEKIIIGAYDGEGYLIWEKAESKRWYSLKDI